MAYTTVDDPSQYFQTALWTGNNTTQAITNDGNSDLQPDLVWLKMRSSEANQNHRWTDSTRGVTKSLNSNNTNAEATEATGLTAFSSDGFTLGGAGGYNGSGRTYVGWQWKANGGTTSSNTDGDITTTVQVNTTAGFSIATYTGNGGSNQTLGHGLGAEPDIVIFKDRDSTSHWRVYTKATGGSNFLNLNTDGAVSASGAIFPNASSTIIGVEQNDVMNKSGSNHVMYSFRSIKGYSKIGTYEGVGGTNGAFAYTGFRPAWLLYRNIDRTENWIIVDAKRNTFNRVAGANLQANVNDAEVNEQRWGFDFLANGFKVRQTQSQNANNGDGETIFYMAFAEHPFVTSKGTPTVAR